MKMFSLLALLLAAACAHQPEPELLVRARENIRLAELAEAPKVAPGEFVAAKLAYEDAKKVVLANDYDHIVNHKVRVADLRAEIALLSAQEVRNQNRLAEIDAKKEGLVRRRKESDDLLKAQQELLVMKEREIEAKRRELADSAEKIKQLQAEQEKMRTELLATVTEIGKIRETKRGLIVSLSNVLFEFNKADLKSGNQKNLARVAQLLADYPDRSILIEGHTDSVGGDGYNQTLSESRAESVRSFLAKEGIPASKMTAKGYGKRFPLATNATASGRQANRRVDIVILNPNEQAKDNVLEILGPDKPA
jgi:outer membrane protein OmpA-like peptidoglycan-associated protein